MSLRRLTLAAAALSTVAAAGCRGRETATRTGAPTGGTVVIAIVSDPDYLLPPLFTFVQSKTVADQIYEHLAEIGPTLNTVGDQGFTPRLADRWTWAPDSLSVAFHIDPRARWHDGVPVRASDVRFSYELYTDPVVGSPVGPNLPDVDSVSVRDSATAVVWYKRRSPEQFFQFAYNVMVVPEHVLGGIKRSELRNAPQVRQPIGSGPFRFVRWDAGSRIELVADTTYRDGRPPLDRVIFSISPDPNAAAAKLLSGDADFFEILVGNNQEAAAKNPNLKLITYPVLAIGYMGFNPRDPRQPARPNALFSDRTLRRALAMALDRHAMVQSVFGANGRVAYGPSPAALSITDTTIQQIPFDTARARQLLDSLGWRVGANGIREKGGKPLRFSLLVPTSSAPRMRLSVLIQQQLRRVGVQVDLDAVEFATFSTRLTAGDFDAVMGALSTDPSPASLRQSWGSSGADVKNGTNYLRYANPRYDALLDSGLAQFDPARERDYLRRANELLVQDAPAAFLYELVNVAGAHKRLQITGIRPDGWWVGLDRWSIPADQRIDRDRIGLQRPRAE